MAARIAATPEMNDADATVKYLFQVQEGDIYKMGDLEVRGLDSKTTERMATAWKLREGDTYDAQYPKKFLETVFSMLPRAERLERRGPRIRRGKGQGGGHLAPLRAQAVNPTGRTIPDYLNSIL